VLAMFPDTTAFYPAKVDGGPNRRKPPHYALIFDDDEGDDGKKVPKRLVAPRFVVALS